MDGVTLPRTPRSTLLVPVYMCECVARVCMCARVCMHVRVSVCLCVCVVCVCCVCGVC